MTLTLQTPEETRHRHGVELFHRGLYEEAVRAIGEALRAAETAERWNDWSAGQLACRRPAAAEEGFRRALSLDAGNAPAAANLGILLASRRRHREALVWLERGVRGLDAAERAALEGFLAECREKAAAVEAGQVAVERARIVVLGPNLVSCGGIEAIANEARGCFEALRREQPGGDFLLVSVEMEATETALDPVDGVLSTSVSGIAEVLARLAPDLVHVFASDLSNLMFLGGDSLLNHRVVFTASCAEPVGQCPEAVKEEIRHLIDQGSFVVVPESPAARILLDQEAIKPHAVIYPAIAGAPAGDGANVSARPFTIGFASSPICEEHWDTRGIPLLLELAARAPETRFLLAWRRHPERILREVAERDLANVDVRMGALDMDRFYAEVDAMILPFTTLWGNHTSPFSALEGLARGKPVLATALVGISGLLETEQVGVVRPASVEALRDGLSELQARYDRLARRGPQFIQERFGVEACMAVYDQVYRTLLERPYGVSLRSWDARLERSGRRLVRGRAALQQHYAQAHVASSYRQERFAVFPGDVLDAWEQSAVQRTVESVFGARRDLKILDVASGEGRIVRALLPYGACTAMDASAPMLDLSAAQSAARLRYVSADVFAENPAEREHYDVVTTFRFLRHFEYPDRRTLYDRLGALLAEDGVLVFDVPNLTSELITRHRAGWEQYPIYDVFWSLDGIREEMAAHGFHLVSCVRVGQGLQPLPELNQQDEPYVWVAAFRKSADGKEAGATEEIVVPRPDLLSAGGRTEADPASTGDRGRARRSRQAGILFQAPVYGGSGYADENLNVVLELERAGLPVQLEPVGLRKDVRNLLSPEVAETLEWLQRPRIDLARSVYYQCTPAHDFNLDVSGRHRIGRTMFETDRLPTGWLERCLTMDEIWLPSEFNRQVFASVGVPERKLRVVPAGVDTAAFRPGLQPLVLPERRGFNFLSVFEWTGRKGADVLLRAYLTEFRPDEDVTLILRTYPRPDPTADLVPRLLHFIEREVGLKLEEAPPILFLPGFLPNQDVPRLYSTADALVLPSRGEGYGRPYMEALSAGLPVIATRWSGQLDFLDDGNSYLVDCAVVPAPPDVDVELFSGHCWAEPDVDSLKACLRAVFRDREEARRRARKGQADMIARYDWTVVGRRWVEEFERLLG